MAETQDTGSGWDRFADLASDLVYEWGKAKIAQEVRPPAPYATPAPYRPGLSVYAPPAAQAAQGGDVARQLGEIFASPRTWIALVAVVGVVVLVKKFS